MKTKRVISIMALILLGGCVMAQSGNELAQKIVLEKAGTLSKILGKNQTVSSLAIEGPISDKDMKFLEKLMNLTKLDLQDVSEFIKVSSFPSLPKLTKLVLPTNTRMPICWYVLIPQRCPNLQVLYMPGFGDYCQLSNGDIESVHFEDMPNLKKVIITTAFHSINRGSSYSLILEGYSDNHRCPHVDTLIALNEYPLSKDMIQNGMLDTNQLAKEYLRHFEVSNIDLSNYEFPLSRDGKVFYGFIPNYIITSMGSICNIPNPTTFNFDYLQENDSRETKQIYSGDLDLRRIKGAIPSAYFKGQKMKSIHFGSGIKTIETDAFHGCTDLEEIVFDYTEDTVYIKHLAFEGCESLRKVVFNCPVNICRNAFQWTSKMSELDTIIFNEAVIIHNNELRVKCSNITFEKDAILFGSAFSKDNDLTSVHFKGNVEAGKAALGPVRDIYFDSIPTYIHPLFCLKSNEKDGFLATNGLNLPNSPNAFDKFKEFGFKDRALIRADANLKYNITQTRGGDILSHIPLDSLSYVQSLTINGIVDDRDFEIIQSQCSGLKYLDLSHAYTTLSPETIQQRRASAKFVSSLFSLASDLIDEKYNNYELSTEEYMSSKLYAELVKSETEFKESDPGCVISSGALNNMASLEELILPLHASTIEKAAFFECHRLRTIKWPPYLKIIEKYAFYKCYDLASITIPSSLQQIAEHAFDGCTNLEKIDLWKCNNPQLSSSIFENCSNIKTLYLPQGSSIVSSFGGNKNNIDIHIPSGAQRLSDEFSQCNLMFYGNQPPIYGECPINCTLYIPKGAMSVYYSALHDCNSKIIEKK